MASMTAKQVAALAKSGEPTRKSDGKGLYFVVPDSGAPYWAFDIVETVVNVNK